MPASFSSSENSQADKPPLDILERFGRTVDLYGEAAWHRFHAATVAVIGLGGVGSHTAHALARSGVGVLVLSDFDSVTPSSLNRNPFAGPGDVGRPKVEVAAEFLGRTCPDTKIVVRQVFCHEETLDEILEPAPNLVVDAIDSLNPKVTLLVACRERGLPVVSSMGAAARSDFTSVRWDDIAATEICPLARQVRRRLRRRGIEDGITCVYSVEVPARPLAPDLGDRTCNRGRERNRQPSQMSLPGIFGYALAALVLDRLAASDESV